MFGSSWLKNHRYFIILALIGLIFLFVYSWLYINIDQKFTSPDETANYYFIKLFAEKSQLRLFEPINQSIDGLIRPRSMGYVNGYTVPGSFLGMILIYGIIAKIFGFWIILYLTPLFSIVGVLFFYLLIKEIFGQRIAFISALLLFVLPPFWYYSSRGMFHNVLFVDLLIIGLYFLIKALSVELKAKNKWLPFLLGGFFIGLSLITRTSEITWVGIILFILFIINWSRVGWRNLLIFLGIIFIIFLPIFFLNNYLYCSPLAFAYSKESVDTDSLESISQTIFLKFRQIILPFGINFDQIGQSAYQYLIIIFSWFSILFIIGFLWSLRNIVLEWLNKIFPEIKISFKLDNKQKIYLWLYSIIALWLIIYYGSYVFYEYIDKTKIILGSSYLRYWLPIYVFGLPFVVLAILRIKYFFQSKILRYIISPAIILLFVFFSIFVVLQDPLQGLIKLKSYVKDYIGKEKIVSELTEKNSVIITGYADKVIFPKRKVIVNFPLDNKRSMAILQSLKSEKIPLYYYQVIIDENNERIVNIIQNANLNLTKIRDISSLEVLYKID